MLISPTLNLATHFETWDFYGGEGLCEDGGGMALQNVSILSHHYTVLQTRRP